MEILGFTLSVVMGFTLGLLGGGGSILTVPILVYVMGINPVLGTAYSLFVVGSTAIVGGWRKHLQALVDWRVALLFALPSLVAVFLTRYYLVPAIPSHLFSIGNLAVKKEMAIMLFFALVMLMASYSMIRERKPEGEGNLKTPKLPLIIVEGLVVGLITGFVGAGGGFLIVPALVLLVGLPIKKAVGTSLVIIAIKSLLGFMGDVGAGQAIDWWFLSLFTAFSIGGMFIGSFATRFIDARHLKKAFGWFVLAMGVFIVINELLLQGG